MEKSLLSKILSIITKPLPLAFIATLIICRISWQVDCSGFIPLLPCDRNLKGLPFPIQEYKCIRGCIKTTIYTPEPVYKWHYLESWLIYFFFDLIFWFVIAKGAQWLIKIITSRNSP